MRTLLCALNSKFIHSSPAVFSLYAAAKQFEEKYNRAVGDLTVLEYTINDVYEIVLNDIMARKPDIVAFSVYIWNVSFISRLTGDIRKICPSCKIIIGGAEVSYGTEHTNLQYNYVIIGEGERSFYALIAKLNNDDFNPDKLFDFEIKGRAVSALPVDELSQIPFIYSDDNISLFENRIIYYESSRGCPFSCAYCLSSVDKGVRFLELERVYSDLSFFLESDVKQVKFVDRTFNCNPDRAYSILDYIITNTKRDDINFHFEVGADLFNDKILDLLSTAPAGLIQLEAGIQSTYEKALLESVRKTDMEKCMSNIKSIIAMGNINMHVDLIAGLPYESIDIFKKSFNDAYMLYSNQLQLGFLKLLAGTVFNSLVDKHEYVFSDNAPYEILSNAYLSYYDILSLKKIEEVVDRLYNSGRFNITLEKLLKLHMDPYSMYESIAEYFEETGHLFKSISSRDLYELLFSYITFAFPDYATEFAKDLLLDFYSSDKSDSPPVCLQYLWESERKSRDKIHAILENNNLVKSAINTIKFIGDKVYVFDYSEKHRVSGRYNFYKL